MPTVFTILMIAALAAVLIVLLMGVVAMIKGGDFNRKYSNKLMRARIALQAFALVIFATAWLIYGA